MALPGPLTPSPAPPPPLPPPTQRTEVFNWKHLTDPNLAYATRGLRGLYNLGNTCFMNCILQALVHNPLLQSFFLHKTHTSAACAKAKALRPATFAANGTPVSSLCLACELQDFFLMMFNREPGPTPPLNQPNSPYEPLVPHRLLQTMWSAASHLAGYEQQDAHEFLIALLDALHNAISPGMPPPET